MFRKPLLLILLFVLAGSGFFINPVYGQPQETREEDWFKPFYYPYTAEGEDWFLSIYHPYAVQEEEAWFRPFISIREQYDDNIFLAPNGEIEDWITTIKPGFVIKPTLKKHRFMFDYLAELNFFAEHDDENNYNHLSNAILQFNFNHNITLELNNMFHYFSDRAGSEDTNRIPRTQDFAGTVLTFGFNKLDLSLWYDYHLEDYRTDGPIGAFMGQALTYEDLDSDEHQGGVEVALKLWPKSALLFSGDYGVVLHDTGRKSDSDYFDVLVGLRGEPTAKCVVEARVGYRGQDFENYNSDFESIVFNGSLIENFTPRDALRIDFIRTTSDTVMPDNAYYETSFIGAGFKHGFTEKFFGDIGFSYEHNDYPTAITVAGKTDKREDNFFSGGIGASYELSEWFIFSLKYDYRVRTSNFSIYDFENNRISASLTGHF